MIPDFEIPEDQFPIETGSINYREFTAQGIQIRLNPYYGGVQVYTPIGNNSIITFFHVKTERGDSGVLKFIKFKLSELPVAEYYRKHKPVYSDFERIQALTQNLIQDYTRSLNICETKDTSEFDEQCEKLMTDILICLTALRYLLGT